MAEHHKPDHAPAKDVLGKPVHTPNPVPEVEEVKDAPSVTKKLKVEKVFVNGTFLVKDGGKDHIVSIPVNREVHPRAGDSVEVVITGEKDAQTIQIAKAQKKSDTEFANKKPGER